MFWYINRLFGLLTFWFVDGSVYRLRMFLVSSRVCFNNLYHKKSRYIRCKLVVIFQNYSVHKATMLNKSNSRLVNGYLASYAMDIFCLGEATETKKYHEFRVIVMSAKFHCDRFCLYRMISSQSHLKLFVILCISLQFKVVETVETHSLISIRHRPDTFASDPCLTNVDQIGFAIWMWSLNIQYTWTWCQRAGK